jgi:activating signal cointegrator complex subunit 3
MAGGKALPKGAKQTTEKGRVEVYIPPVKPDPKKLVERIKVSSLPQFAQAALKGVASLNQVQSKCFHTAFETNENMLVCAPTGAGKTNVALLTVLHEVGLHLENGVLQKDAFKIVFVAPMKALAQEVVRKFSRRLNPLGVEVRELTGDMQLTKKEIAETQMLVTTPEKWDVITRKSGEGSLMEQVVSLPDVVQPNVLLIFHAP